MTGARISAVRLLGGASSMMIRYLVDRVVVARPSAAVQTGLKCRGRRINASGAVVIERSALRVTTGQRFSATVAGERGGDLGIRHHSCSGSMVVTAHGRTTPTRCRGGPNTCTADLHRSVGFRGLICALETGDLERSRAQRGGAAVLNQDRRLHPALQQDRTHCRRRKACKTSPHRQSRPSPSTPSVPAKS